MHQEHLCSQRALWQGRASSNAGLLTSSFQQVLCRAVGENSFAHRLWGVQCRPAGALSPLAQRPLGSG
eukprot:3267024-Alexandrium_andersonii.AAC.1